jgi:hypothetical protein
LRLVLSIWGRRGSLGLRGDDLILSAQEFADRLVWGGFLALLVVVAALVADSRVTVLISVGLRRNVVVRADHIHALLDAFDVFPPLVDVVVQGGD